MITVSNKLIEERISQVKKSLEILGENFSESEITSLILESSFQNKKIIASKKEFSLDELLSKKLEFEKYFLRNKSKTIDNIVYKIRKYNTKLDSIIRKYKRVGNIEEYRNIYKLIQENYNNDINSLILKEINYDDSIENTEEFYKEYLEGKRKVIVDSVISKLGLI